MFIKEFHGQYVLCDGQVVRLHCDFEQGSVLVRLAIRRREGKRSFPCIIELLFLEVSELDLLDTFGFEHYSDVVFVRTSTGQFYASFDPYGNSGLPGNNDNFVIRSERVQLIDKDIVTWLE
jgi:hypothetical protein